MIREAQAGDILALVAFMKSIQAGSAYEGIRHDDGVMRKNFTSMMSSPMHKIWILEIEGEICGALGAISNELWFSRSKFATDLFCVVNDRGRGKGYLLVKRFLDWTRTRPAIKDVTMSISSELGDVERTEALYERLGLKRIGTLFRLEDKHERNI